MKRHRRDIGLEAGHWLLEKLRKRSRLEPDTQNKIDIAGPAVLQEMAVLVDDEELPEYSPAEGFDPPGYRTTDGTPRQSSSRSQSPTARRGDNAASPRSQLKGAQKAFTKHVVLIIIAFGILA